MSYEIPPCSVCNELESGLYNCKICSLAYCSDHLCLHLNVAWETNTWTSRNSNTEDIYVEISNLDGSISNSTISEQSDMVQTSNTVQTNEKTLLSYTETQLEAQLDFYNAQARRIRRELERRSIPLSGIQARKQKSSFHPIKARNVSRSSTNVVRFSSKATSAIDTIQNYLRENRISLEYLKSALQFEIPADKK